jgi:hypothetical protein
VRHVAEACIAGLMLVTPLEVQTSPAVKFTLHIDVVQSNDTPANDWSRFVGQLASQAVPSGGADQTVTVGPKATRMEQHQPLFGTPAGIVTLFREDGEFGFDPSARTFWKEPARLSNQELATMASLKPSITFDKTGKFESINGRRAERVTTTMTMPMPADVAAAPIPGLPPNLIVTIDAWVTDELKMPAGGRMPVIDQKILAALGVSQVEQFTDNRFLLKATMRINFITGVEMVMTVRDVTDVNVPASTFDVPPGFKEVPPPSGRLRAEGASASLAGALAEAGRGGRSTRGARLR